MKKATKPKRKYKKRASKARRPRRLGRPRSNLRAPRRNYATESGMGLLDILKEMDLRIKSLERIFWKR